MNKLVEILLSNVIAPIIVGIVLPGTISLASKAKTDDWINYLNQIPISVWVIFAIIIIGWIIIASIRSRLKHVKKLNTKSGNSIFNVPLRGYIECGEINYQGLVWRVKAPAPDPYDISERPFDLKDVPPNEIEISTPPRCPKCGTELEKKITFWYKYLFECPGCQYNTKSKESYYRTAEKVKKVVKRKIELGEIKNID